MSQQPRHGGAGAPTATCAHPAAGPRVAFPGPRAIRGTAAQPQPRQAGLAGPPLPGHWPGWQQVREFWPVSAESVRASLRAFIEWPIAGAAAPRRPQPEENYEGNS